jgi:hypothetical protein
LTSADGEIWSKRNRGTRQNLCGVVQGGPLGVAVGYNGTILTSRDQAGWTESQLADSFTLLEETAYGNGVFVAVGSLGKVVTSGDGITWNRVDSPTSERLLDVTFSHGVFAAVGQAGALLTSSNGTTWTKRDSGAGPSLSAVTYGDGGVPGGRWR